MCEIVNYTVVGKKKRNGTKEIALLGAAMALFCVIFKYDMQKLSWLAREL